MSGVTFRIEQQSDKQTVLYLQQITPRMITNIHQALKQWIYQGATLSAGKYFGRQSAARGAKNTGDMLVSRTGRLQRSVTANVDSGLEPAAAGPETTVITATWGADTPYARIQEYGGYAGRGHKTYIPPRPYLGTALKDSSGELPALLQAAIEQALAS